MHLPSLRMLKKVLYLVRGFIEHWIRYHGVWYMFVDGCIKTHCCAYMCMY